MAEYIDREKILEHIKDLPTWWSDGGGIYGKPMKYPDGMFDCEDVVASIENAPAADVEHVIRCKDCRYSDDFPFSKKETIYCNMHDVTMCENDFCSRGNSKDEEKEGNG